MTPIIQVDRLSKHFQIARHQRGVWGALRSLINRQYNRIKAVDEISFNIEPGEIVGYIGPNGAGKSTTIKMLAGLLVPTSGDLLVDGRVPWREREAYVRDIGAVFGQRTTVWGDLPGIESLGFLQHI